MPPQSAPLTICTNVQAKTWESRSACDSFLKRKGTDGYPTVLTQVLHLFCHVYTYGTQITPPTPYFFWFSTENFSVNRRFFVCLQCVSKDSPMTEQEVTNTFTYYFMVDKVCSLSFTFSIKLGSIVTADQMEVQKPCPTV